MKKRIEIELRSDMCCGIGEGNGSTLDTIAAFDKFGLPIIPGKTLKGLLKDRCRVFTENGFVNQEALIALFGGRNGQQGRLRLDKGVIENYEAIKADIACFDSATAGVATKGAIRKTFTTERKQTAHDSSGIAKKMSLRATEAVKRHAKFYVDVSVEGGLSPDEEKLLNAGVKTLRHIGMNKNRGFGEVVCKLIDCTNSEQEQTENAALVYKEKGRTVTVKYTVNLLDDVVISAGSNIQQEYISGGMVIGALAKYTMEYPWFKEVVLENTLFSNAYLSENGRDYLPAPMSLCTVKNEKNEVYNLADGHGKDDEKQYVPFDGFVHIKDCDIRNKKVVSTVGFHSTPGTDGAPKNLYSYRTIEEGQRFVGTITADTGAVELLKKVLESRGNTIYLGGSATAEYAGCSFVIGDEVEQEKTTIKQGDKVVVELLSDAVVVDEYGNNSGNIESLLKALYKELGFEPKKVVPYTKTAVVGGFNAKWCLPKRQYTVFLKGTVLELVDCPAKEPEKYGWIGLLNNEGFGQYRVRETGEKVFKVAKPDETDTGTDAESYCEQTRKIIKNVLREQLIGVAKTQAMLKASEVRVEGLPPSSAMRLVALLKTVSKKDGVKENLKKAVESNFKNREDLYKFSNRAIDSFDLCDFSSRCGLSSADAVVKENEDQIFREYIGAYIGQIKRNYRKGEQL